MGLGWGGGVAAAGVLPVLSHGPGECMHACMYYCVRFFLRICSCLHIILHIYFSLDMFLLANGSPTDIPRELVYKLWTLSSYKVDPTR